MPSETELLERARHFDRQALAEIYDLYSPGLYRYAARRLGDRELAEDCVAETFSRLLHALKARKGPRRHLKAYLYRIAHNWIVDHHRSPDPLAELDERIPSESDAPEESAVRSWQQERVRAALRHLTPDQQQVITLKFLEGWNNAEISLALGKPVGAVKSLQHRALARLKRILIERPKEHS